MHLPEAGQIVEEGGAIAGAVVEEEEEIAEEEVIEGEAEPSTRTPVTVQTAANSRNTNLMVYLRPFKPAIILTFPLTEVHTNLHLLKHGRVSILATNPPLHILLHFQLHSNNHTQIIMLMRSIHQINTLCHSNRQQHIIIRAHINPAFFTNTGVPQQTGGSRSPQPAEAFRAAQDRLNFLREMSRSGGGPD
ncbi:MAG: hypothetical protein Q9174_002666 [Haloplaca sp. 1 TL-2023]